MVTNRDPNLPNDEKIEKFAPSQPGCYHILTVQTIWDDASLLFDCLVTDPFIEILVTRS